MYQVSSDVGVSLFNEWGVDSWVGSNNCRYFTWGGCCVFAAIDNNGATQMHMAMRKEERSLCREAVKAFLRLFGNDVLIAPIISDRNSVKNLAVKMGFELFEKEYDNGSNTVDIYVRYPKWVI